MRSDGHAINAVLGHREVLESLCANWRLARTQYLPQDYALCLIGRRLRAELGDADTDQPTPFNDCPGLGAALYQALCEAGSTLPLAYIETDYHNGAGRQAAIVVEGGDLVYGPAVTRDASADDLGPPESRGDRAVNGALTHLGVWTRGIMDAWDTLELYRFRQNPD